ncbi:MAG: NUDIX domain-containing protein [Rhizobiaceae bacterium]|nr:NUDIX domain-containing protein [Rhizobiaceae bacterium]
MLNADSRHPSKLSVSTGTTDDGQKLNSTGPAIMIPGIGADGSLFSIEKIEAHRRDIHHLAISIFLFSGDELLIQRRAMSKYHCGGLWANTCCTHPHFGEDIVAAAHRRLNEELGLKADLKQRRVVEYAADVGNGLHERERVHMFTAQVDKDRLIANLNPDEVSDIKWMSADQLMEDVTVNPQQYTPWFRIYLDRYPGLVF